MLRIALDVMGGDFAPKATIGGAILSHKEIGQQHQIVLIGDEELILSELKKEDYAATNFEIIHAPDIIGMGEHPTKAFAQKPNSSISVGFSLLKDKKIDAFSGAGNSGAMLVGAMFSVKSVPGVIRPCITTLMPKPNGGINLLLDVGTNADCKPDVLYQFGILGSLLAQHVFGISNPKVGLLNIGEEPEKGNLVAQATHQIMKDSRDFNFVGNVEGRDLFSDHADVIVCDGFTGNIVLKQAEAWYTLIKKQGIKNEFFDRFNYEIYGGTPILGINSTVMIGHGISSSIAIKNMLKLSAEITEVKLHEKITKAFQ